MRFQKIGSRVGENGFDVGAVRHGRKKVRRYMALFVMAELDVECKRHRRDPPPFCRATAPRCVEVAHIYCSVDEHLAHASPGNLALPGGDVHVAAKPDIPQSSPIRMPPGRLLEPPKLDFIANSIHEFKCLRHRIALVRIDNEDEVVADNLPGRRRRAASSAGELGADLKLHPDHADLVSEESELLFQVCLAGTVVCRRCRSLESGHGSHPISRHSGCPRSLPTASQIALSTEAMACIERARSEADQR